jgi:hypothetical protein
MPPKGGRKEVADTVSLGESEKGQRRKEKGGSQVDSPPAKSTLNFVDSTPDDSFFWQLSACLLPV